MQIEIYDHKTHGHAGRWVIHVAARIRISQRPQVTQYPTWTALLKAARMLRVEEVNLVVDADFIGVADLRTMSERLAVIGINVLSADWVKDADVSSFLAKEVHHATD